MINPKKTRFLNKHYQALNSDDCDQAFSRSSEGFFLSHFQQNCKNSTTSLQTPNLDLKSLLLQNMKHDLVCDSFKNFRVKSYSFDQCEFINLLNPTNILLKISQERSKLLVELLYYCKEVQSINTISPEILENLCSIISKIISSTIYQLKEFQVKECLKSFEDLIVQVLKGIESQNFQIKQTSPLSILSSPTPTRLNPYEHMTVNLNFLEDDVNTPQLISKYDKRKIIARNQDLKVLKKAKFLLSKLGHCIHWHDVSFLSQEKQGKIIVDEFSLKRNEGLNILEDHKFILMHHNTKLLKELNLCKPEIELLKQRNLQKYFSAKLKKWRNETCEQANIRKSLKNVQSTLETNHMICKICLRNIALKKMAHHSELCMERCEVHRHVEILKGLFTGYCRNANKNAKYFEKVYGIEKKRQPKKRILRKNSGNKTMKTSKSVKNLKGNLKIQIFDDEKFDSINSCDGFSEKRKGFNIDSSFQCQNPAFTQENLTNIIRKIKLYDLIVKTSNFFIHEELDQSFFFFFKIIFFFFACIFFFFL